MEKKIFLYFHFFVDISKLFEFLIFFCCESFQLLTKFPVFFEIFNYLWKFPFFDKISTFLSKFPLFYFRKFPFLYFAKFSLFCENVYFFRNFQLFLEVSISTFLSKFPIHILWEFLLLSKFRLFRGYFYFFFSKFPGLVKFPFFCGNV